MPRKIEVPIKDKILVTRDEAAALMSVSPGTINKLITLKVITPTWSGRNVLIAKTDLPVPGPPFTIITFFLLALTVSTAFLNAY